MTRYSYEALRAVPSPRPPEEEPTILPEPCPFHFGESGVSRQLSPDRQLPGPKRSTPSPISSSARPGPLHDVVKRRSCKLLRCSSFSLRWAPLIRFRFGVMFRNCSQRDYSVAFFGYPNGRTSTEARQAKAALRPHASASFRSAAFSTQKPTRCSFVSV